MKKQTAGRIEQWKLTQYDADAVPVEEAKPAASAAARTAGL